jgi:putative membrane protein
MKRSVPLLALALVLLPQSLFAEKKEKVTVRDDKDFLTKAAIAGAREVKLGEYAAKNASDEKVREFAQQMTRDHSQANDKLTEFARKQKLAVLAGQEKETRDMLDRLSKLKGNDFDREYMKMMVEDHEKAVSLFEAESKKGSDPDLKTFATDTLPALRKHLKEARDLYDRVRK